MEQHQHIASVLALTMGASWASGINLYAAIAVLGFSGATGNIELPPDLQILQNPLVVGAAPAQPETLDQLERLKGLHDSGALTDEEFTMQKGKILVSGADDGQG